MTGWGVQVVGLDAVVDLLEEIQLSWDGDTVYVVAPTVEYAIWHEIGTASMEARPFARPAAERVQAAPVQKAQAVAAAQGIDISTKEGFVEALALAVEREMKQIIEEKDIWDTGTMHGSVTVAEV